MENNTILSERIKKIIDYKGLTINKFSESVEASNSYFNKVLKNNTSIGSDRLEKIIRTYPDISPEWLLTGEGEMIKNADKPSVKKTETLNDGIPLIPVEAMAGIGNGSVAIKERDIQERYLVPDFVESDFMIRVKGPSMEPHFNSGDIIACKIMRDRSFFQWGKVYVIHHREQGTMIKRLFPSDDSMLECKSDNKAFPPFTLEVSQLTNIALVLGVIRLE